jgi:hypothetical protein
MDGCEATVSAADVTWSIGWGSSPTSMRGRLSETDGPCSLTSVGSSSPGTADSTAAALIELASGAGAVEAIVDGVGDEGLSGGWMLVDG